MGRASHVNKREGETGEAAAGSDARVARRMRRTQNTLQWRDVISSAGEKVGADGNNPRGFTQQIPLSLLRDGVFQYLAPPLGSTNPQRALRDGFGSKQYAAQLAPLRAVCRHWYTLAQFLQLESKKSQQVVTFKRASALELKRIIREAKRDGLMAKEISVGVDADTWYCSHSSQAGDGSREIVPLAYWDDFFQCYPHTERLDISQINTQLLDSIVTAASHWLPRVHALILPRRRPSCSIMTIDAVVEALGRWQATNGGLRVLTLPDWIVKQETRYAGFLAAVARFCPRIEYFVSRVPKRLNPLWHQVVHLPPPVWTDFCHKCPLLREFSWNLAPYSKEYTDIFQASRKPQLEVLAMELKFLDQWPIVTDLSLLQSMVAQLPTLRSVEFNMPRIPHQVDFSKTALDELALQLATTCPKLETFKCLRSVEDNDMTIKSATVQALVRNCDVLRALHLNCLQVSDDEEDGLLVEILKSIKLHSVTGHCSVDIHTVDSVNAVVLTMLAYLLETSSTHIPLSQTKVKLQFHVAGVAPSDRNQPEPSEKDTLPSRQQLEQMVEAIIDRYTDSVTYLRVLVRTHRVGHRTFDTIEWITLLMNVDKQTSPFFEGWNPSQDTRTDFDGRGGVFYL